MKKWERSRQRPASLRTRASRLDLGRGAGNLCPSVSSSIDLLQGRTIQQGVSYPWRPGDAPGDWIGR